MDAPTDLARALTEFFSPRISPHNRNDVREIAQELVAAHPQEPFEALAGRLRIKARSHIAAYGAPHAQDILEGRLPRLESEMRVSLAERLSDVPGASPQSSSSSQWASVFTAEQIHAHWLQWADKRKRGEVPTNLQFYAHVPFCRTTCSFCLCPSVIQRNADEPEHYLRAVEEQAEAFRQSVGPLHANVAAIGGGTPSLLSAPQLERLLKALCNRVFTIDQGDFFSVEFNPDSTTREKLEVLKKYGVNRIGYGVQSLDPGVLKSVARGYQTTPHVVQAITAAQEVGFSEISADLLVPLPGETPETYRAGLRLLLETRPDEIVIYHYQPVWRGGRVFKPVDTFPWSLIAQINRVEAQAAGYLALENELGMVLHRPEHIRFPGRYEQFQSKRASSTLAFGPMAQAEVFGQVAYVNQWQEDGTFKYVGELRNADLDKRNFICRTLGSGLPIARSTFLESFGEELVESFPEEVSVLEELGWLVPNGDVWTVPFERRKHAPWLLMHRDRLAQIPQTLQDRTRRSGDERPKSTYEDVSRSIGGLLRHGSRIFAPAESAIDDREIPLVGSWIEILVTNSKKWSWWMANDLSLDVLSWSDRESTFIRRFEKTAHVTGQRLDPLGLKLLARLEALGGINKLVLRLWYNAKGAQSVQLEAHLLPDQGSPLKALGIDGTPKRLHLHGSGTVLYEREADANTHEVLDATGRLLGLREQACPPPAELPRLVSDWCALQGIEPRSTDKFLEMHRLELPSRPKKRGIKQ